MLRTAHGNARDHGRVLVVEGAPVDELPAGTPAESTGPLAPVARTASGRIADRSSAAALGARGGRATAERGARLRALERLGLPPGSGGDLAPFLAAAEEWATAEIKRLAAHVGGGQCPPNVSALVHAAALAMAGSRAAYAKGDAALGSRLTAEARANTLAAHELAAREAKARGGPRASSDAELAALLGLEGTK